jgi:hypothetical protein
MALPDPTKIFIAFGRLENPFTAIIADRSKQERNITIVACFIILYCFQPHISEGFFFEKALLRGRIQVKNGRKKKTHTTHGVMRKESHDWTLVQISKRREIQ